MTYIPTDDVGEDTGAIQEEYNTTLLLPSEDNNKKMTEENISTGGSKKLFVVSVLAFLIGFGVGFLVFADRVPAVDEDVDTTEGTEVVDNGATVGDSVVVVTEPVTVTGVELGVSDQNFGDSVVLDTVNIDRTSWVVVFEDNDGVPGSILGAQLYDAGLIEDGAVSLLRDTVAESTYYVKVHSDDGDRSFDFTKDVAYLDQAGNEVMTTFMTISGTPR